VRFKGDSNLVKLDETNSMADINEITSQIIGAAIEVHNGLGPGLLEGVYIKCLSTELLERGFSVDVERPIPITYK
jgi:GxxExxY protein